MMMRRSRSRSGLIETAFVSKTCSSVEDLDEVDRLANHPVLRTANPGRRHGGGAGLRKSRSETGEVLLGGWGPAASPVWRGDAESVSNQGSPVPAAAIGGPAAAATNPAGRVLGRRALGWPSRMSRSTTVGGLAAAAPSPPPSSAGGGSSCSSWVFQHSGGHPHHAHLANHVPMAYQHRHQLLHGHHQLHHHQRQARSAPSTPPTWSEVLIPTRPYRSPIASTASPAESRRELPDEEARSVSSIQNQQAAIPAAAAAHHQVVRAVIENATTPTSHRDCFTPPALMSDTVGTPAAAAMAVQKTPPNTVQLPAKFGPAAVPHNLLRQQQQVRIHQVESASEEGSANEISSSADVAGCSGNPTSPAAARLPLSLRERIRLEKEAADSSSAESTPQKRNQEGTTAPAKRPSFVVIRRGMEAAPPPGTARLSLAPKPVPDLGGGGKAAAAAGGARSKFFSSGESSCSSAMSSLESVRSNASDFASCCSSEGGLVLGGGLNGSAPVGGVGASRSVSGAGSSMSSQSSTDGSSSCSGHHLHHHHSRPTLELRQGKHGVGNSKFQVLSPISDKSQEQYSSEQSSADANRTPKASPVVNSPAADAVLPDDNSTTPTTDNNNGGGATVDSAAAGGNDNDLVVREALDVPWEVPKLRRRLQQQQEGNLNNLNSGSQLRRAMAVGTEQLRGSDSGISTASQDHETMRDLLNVPWDMPKLRKRAANAGGGVAVDNACRSGRPRSMPADVAAACPFPSSQHNEAAPADPGASRLELVLPQTVPPPPPGFEDAGDEYYLSQGSSANQVETPLRKASAGSRRGPPNPRPRMTLSFGVDPSLKTLMFSTNSPFDLNDCEEVDPTLPLDRQDWYHGATTRQEAENLLRSNQEGTYLVRTVDSSRQEYALSLKSAKGFMHMKIRRDPSSRDFRLSNFERRFVTVSQMVHHYTRNRLPIMGAEHMCLKRPLKEQLL